MIFPSVPLILFVVSLPVFMFLNETCRSEIPETFKFSGAVNVNVNSVILTLSSSVQAINPAQMNSINASA